MYPYYGRTVTLFCFVFKYTKGFNHYFCSGIFLTAPSFSINFVYLFITVVNFDSLLCYNTMPNTLKLNCYYLEKKNKSSNI